MSTNIGPKPFPNRTLEAKGVNKRPAYKELLKTQSTSTRMQDGTSSLPSEGPSLGSEAQQASSETWIHDWADDLIRAVEGSGINLDRLRLENIKPGVPSFRAREAVDSDYEAWL